MLVLLVLGSAHKVMQTGLKVSQTEGVTVLVRELIKQHLARFIRMAPLPPEPKLTGYPGQLQDQGWVAGFRVKRQSVA